MPERPGHDKRSSGDKSTRSSKRADSTSAAGYLPLKPAWLHILLAVAGGQHHGYVIRQEVEERTAGRIRLWPATLYGTLSQLTESGLLEETAEAPLPVEDDDARRRYYRLTRLGDHVLDAETKRLEELVRYARSSRVARAAGG